MVGNNGTGSFFGGGLAWGSPGSLTIDSCTFSGNTAGGGGGAINHSVPATLTNSTISDNESTGDFGGGVYTFSGAALTLRSSTIIGNHAALSGGGLLLEGGTVVTVSNSVIAGNTAPTGGPDCSGTATSEGYNVIGDGSSCSGFTATGDQVGTSGAPIDPLLGPLSDNGGATDTHRPIAGSPLIDAGNPAAPGSGAPACPDVDQRDAPRPFDGDGDMSAVCDIGSVEFGAVTIFSDGFESGDTSAWSSDLP